jgi:Ni,Fe-hydrogenase maturation factor
LITIVFVASATEAIGKELGAVPVIADAQAPDQVAEAVGGANPVVIVDQLTAIGWVDMRHFDRDFRSAR